MTFGGASSFERAAHLRPAAAAQAALPGARTILLWRGLVLMQGDGLARLAMDHPALAESGEGEIFLGLGDAGPIFGRDISGWEPAPEAVGADGAAPQHPAFGTARLAGLREVMTRLTPQDAELVTTARALFCWHQSHRFCAACGMASAIADGGWQRQCPACAARHFPRTDPVVIMLITRGDKVLLGRSPHWPEGMYSLLAGFVEPGETIEAAVRREVLEESGIAVGRVDYACCQPWPFPNSLMFGCTGEALSETITIDPVEIADALWLSREDLVSVFAGDHPTINPPRDGAIAAHLLRYWLADRPH
ncbi:NAD(+) diphosphatase [Pseudooceanicola algae]|uniref:NAD(+) diphosphatase n=1 Tax=Pseudooceanicola algae TaxID=1537215 RepID=UPI001E350FDE|nr:NAD(+) diphosphatase [Pseudooceanicola algae]